MKTHREIRTAIDGLEKTRRTIIELALKEWNETVYWPQRKELREQCAEVGHVWRFSNFGPLGDPWFHCNVCGTSKVERETR